MRILFPALVSLVLAATAFAGDAIRLQIEIPPDVTTLGPGERLEPVQVVGIDAEGSRVGLPGKEIVVAATAGAVEPVAPPYRFAFTAPAAIEGRTTVTLTAFVRGNTTVRGTRSLDVVPTDTYSRLLVLPKEPLLAAGGSTDISVLGQRADRALVPVVDRRVEMSLVGPGKLTFVRLGTFRYEAPDPLPSDLGQVRVVAQFARDTSIKGEAVIRFVGSREPAPEPEVGPRPQPPRPPVRPPVDDGARPSTPPTDGSADTPAPAPPPARGEPVKDGDDDEANEKVQGPVWPSGNMRLASWRCRESGDTTWSHQMKRLPKPGEEFAAPFPRQRLRLVILRDDVTAVAAAWALKDGDDPSDANMVSVDTRRNQAGHLIAIIEADPPADGTALTITLTLKREGAESLEEEVVVRRRPRHKEDDRR